MAELRFGGPNDPALVLDPGDADVQYILMPLQGLIPPTLNRGPMKLQPRASPP